MKSGSNCSGGTGAYLCGVMFLDRLPLVDGRNTIPFGIARTWKTHIARMQVGLVGGKDHVHQGMEPTHKLRHVLRRSARKPGSQETRANEKRIEELLEPILSASNATVIAAYEGKIETLEHQNRIIAEKLQNSMVPESRFEEIIEHSLQFLANPWKLRACGHYHMKRLVLRLAFSEPIAYCRNEGYRTPKTSLPFKVLESFQTGKSDLVRPRRLELPRELPHSDLNAARLPIPPRPQGSGLANPARRMYQTGAPTARLCYGYLLPSWAFQD